MASVKVKQEYAGKSARECYQACVGAIKGAGYAIFKQRDYAWFAIATRVVDGQEVTCNLLTSLGPPPSVELNLSAGQIEQARLERLAQELLEATTKSLA